MELDAFLSQPPAEVADRGFSQAVAVRRYREQARLALIVRAAVLFLLLALLALLPAGALLRAIALQLTALAASPFVPYLGGAIFLVWLAIQPRALRF